MAALSLASGTIEPTNITKSAPAANPSTAPVKWAPTRREMAYPASAARAQTMATIVHPTMIVLDFLPADFISVAEPIASGRFDTKIATSSATLTPSPAAGPMPSTVCSYPVQQSAPNKRGQPADSPPERPPIRVT
jgi:hypothetical protein